MPGIFQQIPFTIGSRRMRSAVRAVCAAALLLVGVSVSPSFAKANSSATIAGTADVRGFLKMPSATLFGHTDEEREQVLVADAASGLTNPSSDAAAAPAYDLSQIIRFFLKVCG